MDPEIFYCADCNANGLNSEVRLNKHGRCERCDGDSVASLGGITSLIEPQPRAQHEGAVRLGMPRVPATSGLE